MLPNSLRGSHRVVAQLDFSIGKRNENLDLDVVGSPVEARKSYLATSREPAELPHTAPRYQDVDA